MTPHRYPPLLVFAVLATLFVFNGVVSYRNVHQLSDDAKWVAHTQEVIGALHAIRGNMHEARSFQRTFFLTDDDSLQGQFESSVKRARARLAALAAQVGDNPVQRGRVTQLEQAMEATMRGWRDAVQAYRQQGFEAARAIVRSGVNDRLIASTEAILDEMENSEQQLLAARQLQTNSAYRTAVGAGLALIVLGLAGISLLAWLLGRYLNAQQQAASEVFTQRQLLQATLSSIGDGVITTDREGVVTYSNEIAQHLTGWAAEDAIGRPLVEVFHIINEDTRQIVASPIMLALAEGKIVGLANHTILISKDGSEWPLDDSAAPIRDEAGNVSGAVLIFREVSERRMKEQQLTQREEQFRSLAETIPQLCFMSDADGRVGWFNQRFYDFAGTTREEVETSGWESVHHRDHIERVKVQFAAAMEAGESWEDTFPLRRHDGVYRWHLGRALPIKDAGGKVVRWFGTNTDITEAREAEERVRASESHLRAVLDSLSAYVAVLDIDGVVTEINRAALDTIGASRAEMVGKRFTETFWWSNDESRRDLRRAIDHALAGQSSRYDLILPIPDGETSDLDFMLNPMFDADGRVTHLVPSAVDITERKRAERALQFQTSTTKRLLDANIIGIIVVNEDHILSANESFLRSLGYSHEDLIGGRLKWRDITPPEYQPHDARAILQLRTEGVFSPFQKDYLHKDGHRVPILLGGAMLDSAADTWVCFVQDLTPIKAVENQLREADVRKDEFLATLAHELRNPLAPIVNSLHLMRLAQHDQEIVEKARATMERQLTHMVRLVDDLMDISRISRGAIELRKERIDLATVMQSALEASRPQMDEMGHHLDMAMPSEPILLDADSTRIAQVFTNLLNNASKYTNRGGHIRIAVEPSSTDVAITVQDNGIGIRADVLPYVFDMFVQADHSLERSHGGLGVGLTLVKRLVDMHGGTVGAASDGDDAGSIFTVRLPRAHHSPLGAGDRSSSAQHPDAGLRILIVDDNADSADSLATIMSLMGHEVLVAYDGEAALSLALSSVPDAILLDIGLPRLNGYDVCRRIRQVPGGDNITIIAQTGWGQTEDRVRTLEAGFDHHLVKPVDPNLLANVLNSERRAH